MDTSTEASASDLCFIQTLPVETLSHIFGFLPKESDKIKLSQTCQRFRRVVEITLLRALLCRVREGPCLQTLRELSFTNFASRLQHLFVSTNKYKPPTPWDWKSLSSVVAACLPLLPSLKHLTIEPQLLDNLLFHNILLSSSLESFGFFHILQSCTLPLELDFRAVPREGRRIFIEEPLEFWVPEERFAWVNSLLELLEHHQVVSKSIRIHLDTSLPDDCPLLLHRPLVDIEKLHVVVARSHSLSLFRWLAKALASQSLPSLWSATVEVRSDIMVDEDGPIDVWDGVSFKLEEETWIPRPGIVAMTPATDEEELFVQWESIGIHYYRLGSLSGEIGSLKLQIAPGQMIFPSHLVSLARHLPTLTSLDLSAVVQNLRWLDWTSFLAAFAHLPSLEFLTLRCTLTPKRTITSTLGCSRSTCSLTATRPDLERDRQLVGGTEAIWNVGRDVNVGRLRLLADVLKEGAKVHWRILSVECFEGIDEQWAARFDGTVVELEDGSRELVEDVSEEKPIGIEGVRCFSCFYINSTGLVDPVQSLKSCSVREVRAALENGGFDLVSFDASPLSNEAGPESLEVFLRTGTPPLASINP